MQTVESCWFEKFEIDVQSWETIIRDMGRDVGAELTKIQSITARCDMSYDQECLSIERKSGGLSVYIQRSDVKSELETDCTSILGRVQQQILLELNKDEPYGTLFLGELREQRKSEKAAALQKQKDKAVAARLAKLKPGVPREPRNSKSTRTSVDLIHLINTHAPVICKYFGYHLRFNIFLLFSVQPDESGVFSSSQVVGSSNAENHNLTDIDINTPLLEDAPPEQDDSESDRDEEAQLYANSVGVTSTTDDETHSTSIHHHADPDLTHRAAAEHNNSSQRSSSPPPLLIRRPRLSADEENGESEGSTSEEEYLDRRRHGNKTASSRKRVFYHNSKRAENNSPPRSSGNSTEMLGESSVVSLNCINTRIRLRGINKSSHALNIVCGTFASLVEQDICQQVMADARRDENILSFWSCLRDIMEAGDADVVLSGESLKDLIVAAKCAAITVTECGLYPRLE